MRIPRIVAITLLVLSSFGATGVAPTKTELETMYDKAFREFDAAQYDEALKSLDAIDARQPDLAESENLRGVVLMRKGDYDKAETALRKAIDIEPKFWNASFNLAEIPFLRKNWAEARNRFEALVAGNSDEMRGETTLLIQYKIFLTFVLQDRENMVDWIMNKFEGEKDSPALYYSNAALALKHDKKKEAQDWMDAATKHYPAQLNKLFAESFYEIGWLQKPAGESRAAVEITSTAERAERMKADAQANFERAERAFQQRDFAGAIKYLDLADEGAPNQAPSYNLRGEILMEQKMFDEAEEAFHKAFNADPKFREAQYNLAQIPFKKKDYAKSRERLEALFGETPGGEKNQAAQLIKYKIYMTLLLEGNDSQAQKMMDQFKFTGDTPALYYAQAAWAFKHGNGDQGNDWISSARKIYSPALNVVFADGFYDLGWLQRAPETAPATTALAQANASPTGPTPAMRFGQSETLPAPAAPTAEQPAASPAATIATAAASVAPTAAPAASVASGIAAAVAASTPVAVLATPSPALAAVAKPTAAPVQKKVAPQIVSAKSAASPAATALAPARIREWAQPSFAELMDRAAEPRTLLFAGLLLAGTLLLGWLIVQQVRRPQRAVAYETSLPFSEPRFAGPGSLSGKPSTKERRITREEIESGPPKLSLHLKGSEPAVRPTVLPSGVVGARGAAAGPAAPLPILPTDGSVSEVKPVEPPVTKPPTKIPDLVTAAPLSKVPPKEPVALPPLRDEEEVSRAAAPGVPIKPAIPEKIAAEKSLPEIAQPVVPVLPKPILPIVEPVVARHEPIGQGQPIPQLTASTPTEPVMSELTEPEKPTPPIAPETAAAAAIAGSHAAPQSPVETPSFASKIITTKPTTPPPTIPVIMPEPTPIIAINEPRPAAAPGVPAMPGATPSASMQTAVQLTFSLEIASLQLTPTFKMGALQVKPVSKIVSMRLAPSAQPQPAMNLQVTFELSSIQLGAGASIGTVRLTPSSAQRPMPITSPSFEISGLQLISSSAAAPVQLTPTHQVQASVLMTANFQIATVEFSPSFEIASVVLNSTSKTVAVQLPGAGPSSIEAAPVFEIGNVQLGGNNELAMLQLTPLGAGRRA